ncbi:hypothetical protein DPMN_194410 [Dreissena polymorpha]|uniref:Uncharacterized protein n=2 Tax=Dreissena polymorpha TaxID=45954 RepID=A0A9D4BDX4_DREPO|nr:hypothetical protein DPMN_194410 [Dreissena polymorpha]
MGLRNVEFAAKRKTTTDDPSLQATIRCMENDKSKTWTSVELHSFYTGNGGSLPRKTLVQKLSDVFGDELLVLSSKGLANIVIFRNKASTLLRLDDLDEDAIPIEYTAKQIVSEWKKIHYNKDKYNIRIDRKLAAEQSSATLSKLLSCMSEKLSNTLPALLICNMVTGLVNNKPTSLQIALGIETREKACIQNLYDFGVTCSYDEVLRFKTSAAVSTVAEEQNPSLRPITDANEDLIQAVADNFDANVSSQNGLKSTHALALLLTQNKRTLDITPGYNRTIDRISRDAMKLQ